MTNNKLITLWDEYSDSIGNDYFGKSLKEFGWSFVWDKAKMCLAKTGT